jgi:uncharacterized protein YndB with AHSA1/START domain
MAPSTSTSARITPSIRLTAQTVITVTFAEQHGRTTMTFEQAGLASEASRDSHGGGWTEAFDNLSGHLQLGGDDADRTIAFSCVFHASRQDVSRAYTESDQLVRWYGPRGFSARIERNDLRDGGSWRYVMIGPDARPAQNGALNDASC